MADREEILQAAIEAAKAMVLAINGEDRRQGIHSQQNGVSANTRQRMGLFMRQPVFNCTAVDKYLELKNFKMEITNIFLTKHYDINGAEKFL